MRPKIISHMVSSIDGRLLTERWTQPTNESKDKLLALYEQVADGLNADGWLAENPWRITRKVHQKTT